MALISINKNELPATSFGRGAASAPRVGIGDNGQVRLSSMLTNDVVGKANKAVITFDDETRVLSVYPVLGVPKGKSEENLFTISRGKDGESKQAFFSASALLSLEAIGYNYKASGSQVFDCEVSTTKGGNKFFSFVLPKGSLTPRPKVERKKATPAPATPAKTAPTPADDDID